MTRTVSSGCCDSKAGSNVRRASLRLFAAPMVSVSGCAKACVGVQTNKAKRLSRKIDRWKPACFFINTLVIVVRSRIRFLEIKLVLHVDAIFDQFLSESRLRFKRKAIRGAPSASHRDVGVVDDQSVVVRTVEAVIDGGPEFIGEVVFLFRR